MSTQPELVTHLTHDKLDPVVLSIEDASHLRAQYLELMRLGERCGFGITLNIYRLTPATAWEVFPDGSDKTLTVQGAIGVRHIGERVWDVGVHHVCVFTGDLPEPIR